MPVFNNANEKYNAMLGQDVYQVIRLDILNSTKKFKCYKLLIRIVPAGYQENKCKHHEWQQDMPNKSIEIKEENYDVTKLISNNYEEVNFNEETKKQIHLKNKEKSKLKRLEMKHKALFQGMARKHNKYKVKLNIKDGALSRY